MATSEMKLVGRIEVEPSAELRSGLAYIPGEFLFEDGKCVGFELASDIKIGSHGMFTSSEKA